ncbi:hypothetical protein RCG19_11925 [Neobacillus sp. OS1-2]|uniref:hypothetical protein n=1 Tax=Neobacillus sp. OS1-2 TaxID=3070680 RepID=UPI0027E1DEEE|nr:hypothetical protein [Neobacillus sp. OS1-2]WML37957.1 hypothetical protein RCG19_11925 [Neobacillus sp. OS1-2]
MSVNRGILPELSKLTAMTHEELITLEPSMIILDEFHAAGQKNGEERSCVFGAGY